MGVRERMKRYRSEGAAADLSLVQVLVPPESRELVVRLASVLRQLHRNSDQKALWRVQDRIALALGDNPVEIQARNSFAAFADSLFEMKELVEHDW